MSNFVHLPTFELWESFFLSVVHILHPESLVLWMSLILWKNLFDLVILTIFLKNRRVWNVLLVSWLWLLMKVHDVSNSFFTDQKKIYAMTLQHIETFFNKVLFLILRTSRERSEDKCALFQVEHMCLVIFNEIWQISMFFSLRCSSF
jgi:hypothetical protein